MNEIIERELDWDDCIENDSPELVILPEGDYAFKVTKFERGRFAGSEKLPPCNKAILTLEVNSEYGKAIIIHNLFLHTKTEGLICAFFTAIGHRKKGERLCMDWNKVTGATGHCRVSVHEFIKRDGTVGKSNNIEKFYPPYELNEASAEENISPQTAYTAGAF